MKRRSVFTSILLLLGLTCGHAQSINLDWVYTYTFPGPSSSVYGGVPEGSGGYYLLGHYLETSCFSGQGVICKVSAQGGQSWAKAFVADTGCIQETVSNIRLLGNDIYFSGDRQQGWLVKLDSSGFITWQQDSGANFDFMLLNNGNRITVITPPGDTVFTYDTSGVFQWSTFLPQTFSPSAYSGIESAGKSYVLTTMVDTGFGENTGIGLFALATNGALVFDTLINYHTSSDPDYPVGIDANENGDIFLLSKDVTSSGIFINRYTPSTNNILFASYIPGINGTPQGIDVDTLNHLIYAYSRTSDGFRIIKSDYQLNPIDTIIMDTCIVNSVVAAVSPNGYFYCAYRPFGSNKLLYLMAYDAAGNCVETVSYLDSVNFTPKYLQFDSLGNVFISGIGSGPTGSVGFVIRYNSTVGVVEQHGESGAVQLYPNPVANQLTISVPVNTQNNQLLLYSISGALIDRCDFIGNSYVLQTGGYSNGTYLLKVITQTGQTETHKLIIQHQ